MRERVELAGGELRIESRPGSGTRITASLPLNGAEAESGEGAEPHTTGQG